MDVTTVVSSFVALAGFLLLSLAAGAPGMKFQPGSWYEALSKPGWLPPDWLFPIVWTTLYIMMGVAAWLVWQAAGFALGGPVLGLFVLQLAANAMWSWIFFGRHRIGLALVDALVLLALVVATTVGFWRFSRPAGVLMSPYAAWVAFAVLLNLSIWRRNRRPGRGRAGGTSRG
ncbi:MAG TPA: TspO/MBR family protein [Gammaproteobacteria bacterium]|nr:TspO/MBR family protein [Gammaproteobacteria bacterium]